MREGRGGGKGRTKGRGGDPASPLTTCGHGLWRAGLLPLRRTAATGHGGTACLDGGTDCLDGGTDCLDPHIMKIIASLISCGRVETTITESEFRRVRGFLKKILAWSSASQPLEARGPVLGGGPTFIVFLFGAEAERAGTGNAQRRAAAGACAARPWRRCTGGRSGGGNLSVDSVRQGDPLHYYRLTHHLILNSVIH